MERTYTINLEAKDAAGVLSALQAIAAALQTVHPLATETASALQAMGRSAQGTGPHFAAMTEHILAFRAANFVISEAKQALGAYKAELDAVRDYLVKVAEGNLKLRDSLRELRFIRGETGGGGSVPEEVLKFSAQTGMRTDEAGKFLKAHSDALSSLSEADRPSEAVSAAVSAEVAKLAVRADMDPTATAKTLGIMGRFGEMKTADEGVNNFGIVAKNLGIRSMADFKQLAPHFFGLANEMVGEGEGMPFRNTGDLAATYAAGTTAFGGRSQTAQTATGLKQAIRLVNHLRGDEGDALKGMGVAEGDDFMTALRKVAPHVQGEGGDRRFLEKHGFKNTTEIAAVLKFARVLPAIEEGLKQNESDRVTGDAGREMMAGNLAGEQDEAILNRKADASLEIARHLAGKPGEFLQVARKTAEAGLVDRGTILADGQRTVGQWLADKSAFAFTPGGARGEAIDAEVFNRTVAAGRKVGLDLDPSGDLMRGNLPGQADRGTRLNEMMAQIGAQKGGAEALGSVFRSPEIEQKLDKMIEVLQQSKGNAFGLPAPAAGPAAQPVRPRRPGG